MRTKPHLQNGIVHECIYTAVIYEDSTSYDYSKVIDTLCSYPEYAFIRHNLESVKPHTHILFRFPDKKQLNVVASELGIPENIIKWRNSFKASFQYLTHENSKCFKDVEKGEKHVYSHDLIVSSFSDEEIEKFFSKSKKDLDEEECSKVISLLEYMESDECVSIRSLVRWACNNKCWSTLRRGGSTLMRCYDEVENQRIKSKFDEKCKMRKEVNEELRKKVSDIPDGFSSADDVSF